MICPERHRLADGYRVAVEAFQHAVIALREQERSASDQAFIETERRRFECAEARIALEDHRSAHKY